MVSQLFTPLRIGPIEIANRVIVAPMCQYSAENGEANTWHRVHVATLALSGAGLVTVEATAPEARGRITHNCLGLYSDETEAALAPVFQTARAVSDTPLAIQIGHAGRKASTQRPWEGRGPLGPDESPWETLGPTATPFFAGGPSPREMTEADLRAVRDAHVDAALRARRIGFEMLELHAGHGYLMSTFLSPLSNTRSDGYGGSPLARRRYLIETAEAIRAVWPRDRAISVKFNGSDWADGGLVPSDAVDIAGALAEVGVDLVTTSGGGVVQGPPPAATPGYQAEAARLVKAAGIPIVVAAVGMIHDPRLAEDLVASGAVDAVSIARAFLDNPRWAYHAAASLGVDLAYPPPYARASPAAWPPALRR